MAHFARSLLVLTALSACVLPPPPPDAGQDVDGGPPEDFDGGDPELAALTRSIDDAITRNQPVPQTGVAVAVLRHGELYFAGGFGLRDWEEGLPVTEETAFGIGTAAQGFTALSLALAQEDGKLDWDAPVRTYLPTFKVADAVATQSMTAVDLLANRSGLPPHNLLWYFGSLSRTELFDRLQFLEDSSAAGYEFRNGFVPNALMYVTAALLLEARTGTSWEQFIEARIFEPLGMSGASAVPSQLLSAPNHAVGYHGAGRIPYYRNAAAIAPAGAISANARDLARWVRLHLEQGVAESGTRLLSAASVEKLISPLNALPGSAEKYGMGWQVATLDGFRLVRTRGYADGYSTHVSFIPELDMGVVVLVNDQYVALNDQVARAVYEQLFSADAVGTAKFQGLAALIDATLPAAYPADEYEAVSLTGGTVGATFRHPAYGDLTTYALPDSRLALKYGDDVWPVSACSATTSTCTVSIHIAGRVLPLPMGLVLSGTTTMALILPVTGVAGTNVRFDRVP